MKMSVTDRLRGFKVLLLFIISTSCYFIIVTDRLRGFKVLLRRN